MNHKVQLMYFPGRSGVYYTSVLTVNTIFTPVCIEYNVLPIKSICVYNNTECILYTRYLLYIE